MRIRTWNRRHQVKAKCWIFCGKFLWRFWAIMALVSIALLSFYTIFILPGVSGASQLSFAESTIIYDREALNPESNPNEHILYTIHGEENREYVPLKEISPYVLNATIAIEDDNFYHHFGFDVLAIGRAVLAEFGFGAKRGGSTITQQLVKNSFLSSERSYLRKFNEILLSVKVENNYEKDKILELYLNKIPYGNNAHGIEAAAKHFFGKTSRKLTLAESVILASLPAAPTRFSPYGSRLKLLMGYTKELENGELEYHKGRKDLVLERMLKLEMITQVEFDQAWQESQKIEFKNNKTEIKAPHFVFLVRQQLEDKYGRNFLKNGGLKIYTTLDPNLQKIAEETIEERTTAFGYANRYGANNAALAAINNYNGQILAYVGGRDYFDQEHDGQVDILTSFRQPGSSFKPFVYLAAFLAGYSPGTILFDVETDFGGNYKPQNFDASFQGPVTARNALNNSLNIPAVKMAYLATPKFIINLAKKIGIKIKGTADEHGVAIGIGVANVQPLSIISAYQVFANYGTYFAPTSILEIHNSQGKILERFSREKNYQNEIVGKIETALVSKILTDEKSRPETLTGNEENPEETFAWNRYLQIGKPQTVNKDGEEPSNFYKIDNGAKTGTSNRRVKNPDFDQEFFDKIDNPIAREDYIKNNPVTVILPGDSWTIGFTPEISAGAWVGNNDGKPMNGGATGLTVAAPIWHDFMVKSMDYLTRNSRIKYFLHCSPIEDLNCKNDSLSADKNSKKEVATEFSQENLAIENDNYLLKVFTSYPDIKLESKEINKYSGKIATEKTPANLKITELFNSKTLPAEFDQDVSIAKIDRRTGKTATPSTPFYLVEEKPVFNLHSIKPLMPNWENPVQEWLKKQSSIVSNDFSLLRKISQENSNNPVYRKFLQANIPRVEIISPHNQGTIASGLVQVEIKINSRFPVRNVKYSIDNELVAVKDFTPWSSQIEVDAKFADGKKHTLEVIATNNLNQTGKSRLRFEVAPDTSPPKINILTPKTGIKIPINTDTQILTQVTDYNSAVKKVEFWWKGASEKAEKLISTDLKPPFETFLYTGKKLGKGFLTVKAWDIYDNFSQEKQVISFVREDFPSKIPTLEDLELYRDYGFVKVSLPANGEISWIEVVITGLKSNEIIYNGKVIKPHRAVQFSTPRVFGQKVSLEIFYQKNGSKIIEKLPRKIVNL